MLFPILSIPSVAAKSPFFDLGRGWNQMINTPSVLWSGLAIAISISLFNFFGLSVTRHVSATARSLVDTCRTLVIWIISLGLGWEHFVVPFSFLQVLGFSFLVYGTVSDSFSRDTPTFEMCILISICISVLIQQPCSGASLHPYACRGACYRWQGRGRARRFVERACG